MKKLIGLLVLVVALGSYSFFVLYQADQKQSENGLRGILPEHVLIDSLKITNEDKQISLSFEDGLWWVTHPHRYLADQDFVNKSLQIMHETPAMNQFELQEDHFGLSPGKAFIEIKYENSMNKRLVIGQQDGPGNSIYILDKDSQKVSVLHNIWGQLLYFPASRFYNQGLPIPDKSVKRVSLLRNQKVQWSLASVDNTLMELTYLGEVFCSRKAQWLWFFDKIKDFKIEDLSFRSISDNSMPWTLSFDTSKGNIRFYFDEQASKIIIPRFNVIGKVAPGSLESLSQEIQKVIKSDKK